MPLEIGSTQLSGEPCREQGMRWAARTAVRIAAAAEEGGRENLATERSEEVLVAAVSIPVA